MSGRAILTCEEVREAEQRAVAAGGVTMRGLMERAGEACARELVARLGPGRVAVLAGPGNNGGDAFDAAAVLRDLGRDVVLYELDGGARTPEAAEARARWGGPILPLAGLTLDPGDVVLDGLFGAGLARPLGGAAAEAVARVAASGAQVLAVDVPSGVRGDHGALDGPAMWATATVTFGALKPAHVLQPAAGACGDVVVSEIGFGTHLGEMRARLNSPAAWAERIPWPQPQSHKHARGRLMVVSGGMAHTGAARLAARAGLRSGAGAVTLLTPPSALMVAASSVTAVMTSSFADVAELLSLTERASAVVIGPAAGVTEATRANVEALAGAGRSLVLDADALSVFAPDDGALRHVLAGEAVLTPHSGEFERLFPGMLTGAINRIEAAREAARRSGAVVLLKGFDTTVAAPDGRAAVNTHATPFLATAGSGDVLAGVIGGLMAQGLEAFDAACAGAWMHGDAGLRVGPGLTAEDLDSALRETLAELYAHRHRPVI